MVLILAKNPQIPYEVAMKEIGNSSMLPMNAKLKVAVMPNLELRTNIAMTITLFV